MKGLVKKYPKEGLWLEEMATPVAAAGEVLIKTIKSAICGTDVHIYKWDAWAQKNVPVPLKIGHEFVGEVVACGEGVNIAIGTRVTGEGHFTCGSCAGCRSGNRHLCSKVRGFGYHVTGCFSEYFVFPACNLVVIPDDVPSDIAAIFDPFGNALHTAMSANLLGETVLVTGAGPIGLMGAAIARHAGARHVIVTDVNPRRLQLAMRMGATAVVNVAEQDLQTALLEIGVVEGVTFAMEMSGSAAALSKLLEVCRYGATVALLGILPPGTLIDWDLVVFKMLTLKGIYGRRIFNTWDKMIALVESGLDISSVITHRYPAEEFEKGFQAMMNGEAAKVILDW